MSNYVPTNLRNLNINEKFLDYEEVIKNLNNIISNHIK